MHRKNHSRDQPYLPELIKQAIQYKQPDLTLEVAAFFGISTNETYALFYPKHHFEFHDLGALPNDATAKQVAGRILEFIDLKKQINAKRKNPLHSQLGD